MRVKRCPSPRAGPVWADQTDRRRRSVKAVPATAQTRQQTRERRPQTPRPRPRPASRPSARGTRGAGPGRRWAGARRAGCREPGARRADRTPFPPEHVLRSRSRRPPQRPLIPQTLSGVRDALLSRRLTPRAIADREASSLPAPGVGAPRSGALFRAGRPATRPDSGAAPPGSAPLGLRRPGLLPPLGSPAPEGRGTAAGGRAGGHRPGSTCPPAAGCAALLGPGLPEPGAPTTDAASEAQPLRAPGQQAGPGGRPVEAGAAAARARGTSPSPRGLRARSASPRPRPGRSLHGRLCANSPAEETLKRPLPEPRTDHRRPAETKLSRGRPRRPPRRPFPTRPNFWRALMMSLPPVPASASAGGAHWGGGHGQCGRRGTSAAAPALGGKGRSGGRRPPQFRAGAVRGLGLAARGQDRGSQTRPSDTAQRRRPPSAPRGPDCASRPAGEARAGARGGAGSRRVCGRVLAGSAAPSRALFPHLPRRERRSDPSATPAFWEEGPLRRRAWLGVFVGVQGR